MGGRDRAASPTGATPDFAGDVDPDRRRAGRDGGLEPGRAGEPDTGTTAHRLLWFGALWLAGVGTITLVACILRAVIVP